MKILLFLLFSVLLAGSVFVVNKSHPAPSDPCDSYSDCISSSITYIRANPDRSLYLGDSFSVALTIITGPNTTGYSVYWAYDSSTFTRSENTFTVAGNETGVFSIAASVTFTGSAFSSTLTVSQSVTIIQLSISLQTQLVNSTDAHGFVERNFDGSFYRNDTFCDSWHATFQFASQRSDIKINVTWVAPSLRLVNYSADPLGRSGELCYEVAMDAGYTPSNVTLASRALNWQGVSLALKEESQPFAVVGYNPQFTTYAYMEYRNSTAPSSLERPWVLFVRYDGNEPGYSYAGNSNTSPFNGSETFAERAYLDNFTFASLSYQPYNVTGIFGYHVVNSTGALRYRWLNGSGSAVLEGSKRIEKYAFEVEPYSLTPLLGQGYAYQNTTMAGHWTHENGYALKKNYWLVPFLWSGRVNVVSVDSHGNLLPNTPLSVTIRNPFPLDGWLTSNFEHVFGDDPQALRAFEEDLYPTNQTMTFSGLGSMSLIINQTSLVPPQISTTAGGVTQSGNFTFAPVFVNSTIVSVPNALNGTVYYANATIPFWSYNMVQGSLSFLPISTTIDQPTTFLELVNNVSSGWIAGNTTEPQTPSAFESQEYGFWPMGENLTVYANLQGGGVDLLGVQRINPSEYQAAFYIEPWSGGMSAVQLVEGSQLVESESMLNPSAYPSPLPQGLTGLYTVTFSATGQDMKTEFTNVWGARTTVDLGTVTAPAPLTNLVPETTAAAFGIAGIVWLILSGVLKTRKASVHQ